MEGLGIGLIVAGGFLFGVGIGHIVSFASIFATIGVIVIALGLVALFWRPVLGRVREKVIGVTPEAHRPKHNMRL
jgi:hypothetical protein